MSNILVSILMGSKSDWTIMEETSRMLDKLNIPNEARALSAHRTPDALFEYIKSAEHRGAEVFIAAAGGAAHLPGMVASITTIPVIGVPVKSSNSIDGWDSVLSILQMPNGIPVATVALNAAKNAGILAAEIIGTFDENVSLTLEKYKQTLQEEVLHKVEKLKSEWPNEFDQPNG